MYGLKEVIGEDRTNDALAFLHEKTSVLQDIVLAAYGGPHKSTLDPVLHNITNQVNHLNTFSIFSMLNPATILNTLGRVGGNLFLFFLFSS